MLIVKIAPNFLVMLSVWAGACKERKSMEGKKVLLLCIQGMENTCYLRVR